MSRLLASGAGAAILLASPTVAHGQAMSGMAMPTPAAKVPKKTPRSRSAPAKPPRGTPLASVKDKAPAMPGMGVSGMKSAPMAGMSVDSGMAMPGIASKPGMPISGIAMSGTALPAGNAAPPPVPADRYADRQYSPAAMDAANRLMMHQQGGQQFHQVMFNLAEYQLRQGHDGYRWDGEAWFGGDINRAELRTEGTGTARGGTGDAEAQALYSRAVGSYFNLEAGIRRDFEPKPSRTYAAIGVEGLAPYMFQTEARLFVSTRGEVLGRLEAWYDQRLTQRFVLQPRVELNLSAQNTPERRIGGGLADAELGLRLRYEVARQFAPYVGVSYEAAAGRTADYARADGNHPTTTSCVAGVRFWF